MRFNPDAFFSARKPSRTSAAVPSYTARSPGVSITASVRAYRRVNCRPTVLRRLRTIISASNPCSSSTFFGVSLSPLDTNRREKSFCVLSSPGSSSVTVCANGARFSAIGAPEVRNPDPSPLVRSTPYRLAGMLACRFGRMQRASVARMTIPLFVRQTRAENGMQACRLSDKECCAPVRLSLVLTHLTSHPTHKTSSRSPTTAFVDLPLGAWRRSASGRRSIAPAARGRGRRASRRRR